MKVCSSVLCTTPPSPQMVSSSVLSVFLRLGGICSMLRSLLLPPSSSWLSTPALSAVEGLVFPRVVPVFSSPLWLSGRLSLLLSETSWVQQLNSGRLSQKSQLRKVPIVTTLVRLLSIQKASSVSPELVSPV